MESRMLDKLDKIETTMVKQEINLARLTVSVEEHVKRTNMLEEDLKPVKRHIAMVEGALKLIALSGIMASIIEAIHMVFK